MRTWNELPRRARAGAIAKGALGLAFLCRVLGFVLPLRGSTAVTVDGVLETGLFLGAVTSVIAAVRQFTVHERSVENDIAAPRSLKLLLVCISIAFLLMLSMFGIG